MPQSSASTEPEREVISRGTQCDATDTVSRGTQAQYLPEVSSRGTQVQEAALVEVVSRGTQVAGLVESSSASPAAAMDMEEKEWEEWEETSHKLVTTAQSLGIVLTFQSSCTSAEYLCNALEATLLVSMSRPSPGADTTVPWHSCLMDIFMQSTRSSVGCWGFHRAHTPHGIK